MFIIEEFSDKIEHNNVIYKSCNSTVVKNFRNKQTSNMFKFSTTNFINRSKLNKILKDLDLATREYKLAAFE